MKQITIDDMKKNIKKNPILKQYINKGIKEYNLTEEEALDCMIYAWLSGGIND